MRISLICFVMMFSLLSCHEDNDEFVSRRVSNIVLTDLGKIEAKLNFSAYSKGDTLNCSITTFTINKNDTVEEVRAFTQKDHLSIDVKSSPYDLVFDGDSTYFLDERFSMHNVSFQIIGVPKGIYTVDLAVNGTGKGIAGFEVK